MGLGEIETLTGQCKYCGQINAFQWNKSLVPTEKELVEEGTLVCTCESAMEYRRFNDTVAHAEERIKSVFPEDEDDAELREVLLWLVNKVACRNIVSVSLVAGTGVKASFKITSTDKIKIKRTVIEEREETVV